MTSPRRFTPFAACLPVCLLSGCLFSQENARPGGSPTGGTDLVRASLIDRPAPAEEPASPYAARPTPATRPERPETPAPPNPLPPEPLLMPRPQDQPPGPPPAVVEIQPKVLLADARPADAPVVAALRALLDKKPAEALAHLQKQN